MYSTTDHIAIMARSALNRKERSMNKRAKSAAIKMLTQVGEATCRTIGAQCEVVIHDLADLEHSIVWIMGNDVGIGEIEVVLSEPVGRDDCAQIEFVSAYVERGDAVAIAIERTRQAI